MAVYDRNNNPLYFNPITFDANRQSLNSVGLMINFNAKSTLTASASSFAQYDERDYKMNQFQVLYRLNF